MKARQQYILRAVVEEYIHQGEPVSSGFLAEEYRDWDISSATIRNELLRLDEDGFLEQPYTSAGRVPTSKGYRFFVDNFLQGNALDEREFQMLKKMESLSLLGDFLAKEVHSLVLACEDPDYVHEAGLEYLLDEPEFDDRDFLADFLRRVQYLRKDFKTILSFMNSHPHLYIGEEAEELIGDARYTFLITRAAKKGCVAFFGSTRIDYAKGLALAEYLNSYGTFQR